MKAFVEIELTLKQIEALASLQEIARLNAAQGEPGIILAQVGKTSPTGKHLLKAAFVESERAWKIKNILALTPAPEKGEQGK